MQYCKDGIRDKQIRGSKESEKNATHTWPMDFGLWWCSAEKGQPSQQMITE